MSMGGHAQDYENPYGPHVYCICSTYLKLSIVSLKCSYQTKYAMVYLLGVVFPKQQCMGQWDLKRVECT